MKREEKKGGGSGFMLRGKPLVPCRDEVFGFRRLHVGHSGRAVLEGGVLDFEKDYEGEDEGCCE